jgi:hypothetical protein
LHVAAGGRCCPGRARPSLFWCSTTVLALPVCWLWSFLLRVSCCILVACGSLASFPFVARAKCKVGLQLRTANLSFPSSSTRCNNSLQAEHARLTRPTRLTGPDITHADITVCNKVRRFAQPSRASLKVFQSFLDRCPASVC